MTILNKIKLIVLGSFLAVSLLINPLTLSKAQAQDEGAVLGATTMVNQTNINGAKCVDPYKFLSINDQTPTFSGYSTSNVKVILRIKKDGIQRETLADANGYWNYTMNNKIKVGKHTLWILLVDSNNNPSKEIITCSFEIKKPNSAFDAKFKGISSIPDYVLFSLLTMLIVFILFVLYFFLRKRSRKHN